MYYAPGTYIDLSLKKSCEEEPAKEAKSLWPPGTSFSFLQMINGLMVTKISEPPIVLRVAIGA